MFTATYLNSSKLDNDKNVKELKCTHVQMKYDFLLETCCL